MEGEMSIGEWFEGRSVLVTGATGFMGKVLVEKLLRSCSRLDNIYILMRPKRGEDVPVRFQSLLKLPLFDEVRKTKGLLEKVQVMEGDITLPMLGLSLADQSLLRDRVSVVFHSAATVKFDDPLEQSVPVNILATKSVIQLAKSMNKLEAMVHVSTAYCNCDLSEVREVVYPINRDAEKIIQAIHTLDKDLLDSLTPKIIGERPNTYTFTKALAEQIVNKQNGVMPIAIVRPSIVTASYREPLPGWVDNMNGLTGLFVAAGKGVLRTFHCKPHYILDIIPVDYAINFCIAVAWHTAISRPNSIIVYNCTSGAKNPFYWKNLEKLGTSNLRKYPSKEVFWYPGGSFKSSMILNYMAIQFYQRFPAHLADLIARLLGKRPVMIRVQDKLQRAIKTISFFTTREFKFSNDNVTNLWQTLSPEDKITFDFNVSSIDWKEYIKTYILGIRRFVLNEDPKSIPKARRSLFKYYILHHTMQASIYVSLIWLLFTKFQYNKEVLISLVSILTKTVKRLKEIIAH